MNDIAINWVVKKNEDRRANCIFFMGLISATQSEAEKLGFAELSEKLMHLVIEARYAVLDEFLDSSASNVRLVNLTKNKCAFK